jgi:hypothetical protein
MSERRDRLVGFALSGGGNRASVWGLGAVIGYLRARDLEAAKPPAAATAVKTQTRVVSIASVSGGSIANGAIATAVPHLNTTDAATVVKALGPLLKDTADVGIIPAKGRTGAYVFFALGAAALAVVATALAAGGAFGAGRGWSSAHALVYPAVAVLVVTWSLKLKAKAAVIVLALVAGAGTLLTGSHQTIKPVAALGAVALVLWLVAIRLLSQRGRQVERVLDKHFFAGRKLSDLANEVHHIFCATELQTGHQMYQSPRVLSSWNLGHSTDFDKVTLARAVQGSAALPGGFPPQETVLKNAGLTFTGGAAGFHPDRLVLVDGGVYDNMGDQWEQGLAERTSRLPNAQAVQEPANFLIVANAGKALAPLAMGRVSRLGNELRGVLRDQQVQYDQSTAPRRHSLFREFVTAQTDPDRNHSGVIVHAGTSPVSMAKTSKRDDPAKQARGAAWTAVLLARKDKAGWQTMADANADVKTTLAKLGHKTTVDLLEHAIALTQVALHVHYDFGEVDLVDRAELERLVESGG